MANFICEFEGVRGRNLKLYDTKIIITTKKTAGSLITGNFTDGEKTIYLCDIVGVQFKKSGLAIGYLQFETSSMQMNNKNDNFFSENTFTFENRKNGITNELMASLYSYITDRIEELKYNSTIINETPDFEAMQGFKQKIIPEDSSKINEVTEENFVPNPAKTVVPDKYDDYFSCPKCGCTLKKGQKECLCSWQMDWSKYE